MTKPEANAALCRELGVEPCGFHLVGSDGLHFSRPQFSTLSEANAYREDNGHSDYAPCAEYPDLSSADVLMAALDRVRLRYRVSHASSIIWALDCDTHPIKLPPNFPVMLPESTGNWSGISAMHGESGGFMLFRAACAAFGIEVDA